MAASASSSSPAVVAGASSSFSRNHCYPIKTTAALSLQVLSINSIDEFDVLGLSIREGKRRSSSLSNSNNVRRRTRLEITARTTSKNIEVEVDKPLGLTLGQKTGGGVVITAVEGGGNAAKAGLKSGDQVLYTSSFFGDELWPADKLGFTKTAIQAKPDSVYFVVSRGGADVDVKRLPKRPAPPRFGRKLTDTQKASHERSICGSRIFSISCFHIANRDSLFVFVVYRQELLTFVSTAGTYTHCRNHSTSRLKGMYARSV
ncbi:hypothetical protein LINPERPRIM_LOCUS13582 [Linum perenne]